MAYAKKKNLTPYDVLIIASMIDKEVQVPKERELVAAVIYNRLSQRDPARHRRDDPLRDRELHRADHPGRPRQGHAVQHAPQPRPDADPDRQPGARRDQGRGATRRRSTFLYFVVKPGTCGEHSFTASEAEFEQLAAEYQQALEEQGGSPTECPE